jgi:hypothetical protein
MGISYLDRTFGRGEKIARMVINPESFGGLRSLSYFLIDCIPPTDKAVPRCRMPRAEGREGDESDDGTAMQ